MGNSSSSNAKAVMDVVNTSIANISTTSSATSNALQTTINDFTIHVGKSINCGYFLSQGNKGDQVISLSKTCTSLSDLKTTLTNELKTKLSQLTSQQTGALAIGFNCTTEKTDMETHLATFVENNVSSSSVSKIQGIVENYNSGIFEIGYIDCTLKGSVEVTQENITNQVVSLISKDLFNNATATKIGNALDQSSDQSIKQKLIGIIDTLAKLFGGAMLATLLFMMCPCITLICICCACCKGRGDKKSSFSNVKKCNDKNNNKNNKKELQQEQQLIRKKYV